MGIKSGRSPNFRNCETPNLGTQEKRHLDVVPMACHRKYYKGKVVPSSNPGHGESYESMYASNSSMHQKCSNYALINLLFSLCKLI
jgi:hypothetical protein